MAIVRFAMLCDNCGKRSPEYNGWLNCRECMEDFCPDCIAPGSDDDESGNALCKNCAKEQKQEEVA